MCKMIPIDFALFMSLSLISRALALPGDLDPTFDITDLASSFWGEAYAVIACLAPPYPFVQRVLTIITQSR